MTRGVLIDAVPSPIRVAPGDELVAVSAAAEFALGRGALPYVGLSEIASEAKLAELQDAYWDDQTQWLDQLDGLLASLSPTLSRSGFRPVVPAGYMIKTLIDPVFIRAFESDALTRGHWGSIDHHVRPDGPPLLGSVLPAFCRARGVQYRRVGGDGAPVKVRERSTPHALLRSAALRARDDFVMRRSPPLPAGAHGASGLRLLLLSSLYDLTGVLQRNRALGGRSVIVEGRRIIEIGRLGRRNIGRIDEATPQDRLEWRAVAESVCSESGVLRWPASWFEGLAEEIVMERVAHWLTHVMPDVIAYARGFADLFRRESFDAVMAPYIVHPAEAGAVTAARVTGQPPSVVVEHGDTAHLAPSWDLELRSSDFRFVPTAELADYFADRAKRYGGGAAATEIGSYRWLSTAAVRSRASARSRVSTRRLFDRWSVPAGYDPGKPDLVYLVTLIAGDYRYLNNAWYPDAWYFEVQRAIVDVLAEFPRYNVIVKLFPGETLDGRVIAQHVANLTTSHVMTSTAPFSRWLPRADRVVADIASTGFYEALVAGRPSIGLLWKHHVARASAVEALGPALAPFETAADAAEAVRRFAATETLRVPELKPEGDEIVRTLRDVVSKAALGAHHQAPEERSLRR